MLEELSTTSAVYLWTRPHREVMISNNHGYQLYFAGKSQYIPMLQIVLRQLPTKKTYTTKNVTYQ